MMFTILVVDSHKDPFQLRSLRLYHRCLFSAIPEPLTFLFQSNLLCEQSLARRYRGRTKRKIGQGGLRSQTCLEKAQERAKPLGLRLPQQGLGGECCILRRNDDRGLRGLFPHGKEVYLDPQSLRLLGETHSEQSSLQGLQQQGECKDRYNNSLGDTLKQGRRQFHKTKWLSLIQKDYDFLSLLRGYFYVSFKLPPLNLLYQIPRITQIESA